MKILHRIFPLLFVIISLFLSIPLHAFAAVTLCNDDRSGPAVSRVNFDGDRIYAQSFNSGAGGSINQILINATGGGIAGTGDLYVAIFKARPGFAPGQVTTFDNSKPAPFTTINLVTVAHKEAYLYDFAINPADIPPFLCDAPTSIQTFPITTASKPILTPNTYYFLLVYNGTSTFNHGTRTFQWYFDNGSVDSLPDATPWVSNDSGVTWNKLSSTTPSQPFDFQLGFNGTPARQIPDHWIVRLRNSLNLTDNLGSGFYVGVWALGIVFLGLIIRAPPIPTIALSMMMGVGLMLIGLIAPAYMLMLVMVAGAVICAVIFMQLKGGGE